MSDTQQLEAFSPEELIRIIRRDRFVKEQQSHRLMALFNENVEMLAIIQELQADTTQLRAVNEQLREQATTLQDAMMSDVVIAAANNGSE